ncbi:L-threonate dehydrogenase-like [Penaeus chinensis]|uniref:L-threonate dehydrogenase-like n=1 Tax=Penaeus chinensis TaxID=139456 RepID=UPI001FB5E4BF|nr:L-threonate dehydrogenase-like [Penaeus chinensis]
MAFGSVTNIATNSIIIRLPFPNFSFVFFLISSSFSPPFLLRSSTLILSTYFLRVENLPFLPLKPLKISQFLLLFPPSSKFLPRTSQNFLRIYPPCILLANNPPPSSSFPLQCPSSGLPRPPNVKAAAEGPDGILAGLSEGKVWIDHSTTDYEQTLAFGEEAETRGGHVLEAPITGGLEALKKGQMVVHVGGDQQVADAMRPILDASYNKVFYVGKIGSAMMVKVVSNMLACVHIIAMGEVLMLAKRSGLNLKTFWDAIRVSAGNSFVWETGAPLIFNGCYDPGFTMALQNKDLQLGYDMARKFEVPMDMHQLALSIYRRTQYQLGDEAGCYSPPKTYELALGESLQVQDFKDWTYDNEIYKGSLVVSHNNLD